MTLNTGGSERIGIKSAIEGLTLDVNNAIPCGLIINELVSNALRHAFPWGRHGKIDIFMRRDNSGTVALKVVDDGIGFPEDLDFKNTKSLGMQLVVSLVTQLAGVIELDRGEGTSFTITFRT